MSKLLWASSVAVALLVEVGLMSCVEDGLDDIARVDAVVALPVFYIQGRYC